MDNNYPIRASGNDLHRERPVKLSTQSPTPFHSPVKFFVITIFRLKYVPCSFYFSFPFDRKATRSEEFSSLDKLNKIQAGFMVNICEDTTCIAKN